MEKPDLYPKLTAKLADKRASLAPEITKAWNDFSKAVFKEGELPNKTKQFVAVVLALVTQCPYCIKSHTKSALRKGASSEEIMEAIWDASEMRAGGAYAHSVIVLDETEKQK